MDYKCDLWLMEHFFYPSVIVFFRQFIFKSAENKNKKIFLFGMKGTVHIHALRC